jgi:hypothetical protein
MEHPPYTTVYPLRPNAQVRLNGQPNICANCNTPRSTPPSSAHPPLERTLPPLERTPLIVSMIKPESRREASNTLAQLPGDRFSAAYPSMDQGASGKCPYPVSSGVTSRGSSLLTVAIGHVRRRRTPQPCKLWGYEHQVGGAVVWPCAVEKRTGLSLAEPVLAMQPE